MTDRKEIAKTKLKVKANVLEITKKVKINGLVKKTINLSTFSQFRFALRWQEGWEMNASFIVPVGFKIFALVDFALTIWKRVSGKMKIL